METGTVCGLRLDRGYFFIRVPGMDDVFAHFTDLVDVPFDDTLMERRLRFEPLRTERGTKAKNIQPAE